MSPHGRLRCRVIPWPACPATPDPLATGAPHWRPSPPSSTVIRSPSTALFALAVLRPSRLPWSSRLRAETPPTRRALSPIAPPPNYQADRAQAFLDSLLVFPAVVSCLRIASTIPREIPRQHLPRDLRFALRLASTACFQARNAVTPFTVKKKKTKNPLWRLLCRCNGRATATLSSLSG